MEHFPPVETHLIQSAQVSQTFKVQVMQPWMKKGESTRFPVIFATDGNLGFDMLKGISQVIQSSGADSPRFILVGIGYPGDSPKAAELLRVRDLTFPGYPRFNLTPPDVEGVLVAEAGTRDSHGADAFQRFIERELIPLVDDRYPTMRSDRTYFGHSAGGGFGLYTLFTRPQLFENYIISSPGLTYHGTSSAGIWYENYDFVPQFVRKMAAGGALPSDVRLYLSVGSEEEFESHLRQWQLTSSMLRLAALLKAAAIRGLHLHTEVLPGETHMTAWPVAFIHGVRALLRETSLQEGELP